jgi:hypothetical protein
MALTHGKAQAMMRPRITRRVRQISIPGLSAMTRTPWQQLSPNWTGRGEPCALKK